MEPTRPQDVIQEMRDAFPEGERTDRTVSLQGVDLRLQYDPEPGVDLRIQATDPDEPDGGTMQVTGYAPADERPASYPPELPYLPGRKVSLWTSPEGPAAGASATWWTVSDAETALADLRAQSTAAGWTESTGPALSLPPGVRMVTLHRPGQRRVITVAVFGDSGMISLVDSPADDE